MSEKIDEKTNKTILIYFDITKFKLFFKIKTKFKFIREKVSLEKRQKIIIIYSCSFSKKKEIILLIEIKLKTDHKKGMPHLIDHETGLCEVCQRLKLANVRDMKVHKRLGFEARKKAVEKIKTTLKDPRHQRIVNNNYVHYETTKHNYFNVDTEDKTGVTIQNRLPKNVPLSREMHFTQTAGIGITNLATIDEQTVLVNETNRKTTIKKTVDKGVPANLVDYRYNSAVVMSKTKDPRATVVVKMKNKEKFTKLSQVKRLNKFFKIFIYIFEDFIFCNFFIKTKINRVKMC